MSFLRRYRTAALAVAACGIGVAAPAQNEPEVGDPLLEQSRALASELGARLKTALTEAVANDGPVAAIAVCKELAPQIAAQLSADSGARVGRTSDRVRNPHNVPADWQADVLERFRIALAEGVSPGALEHFERSPSGSRYMRPIVTEGLCLMCHGGDLAPAVREALTAAYPDDQATGYSAGELRGAFVVAWPERY